MNPVIQQILSFSIIITVVTGLARAQKIAPAYYPFLWLIILGFINEVISFVLIFTHHYNIVNTNIYTFVESLIILWQFYRWDLFNRKKETYLLLVTVLILYWLVDNFWLESLTHKFNSYFIIFWSYLTVILSITLINKIIISEKGVLVRNATFIICIGFIIFFTYATFVEIFWKYGFGNGTHLTKYVYGIMTVLNAFINLIYALAFLWIPNKPKFFLLS